MRDKVQVYRLEDNQLVATGECELIVSAVGSRGLRETLGHLYVGEWQVPAAAEELERRVHRIIFANGEVLLTRFHCLPDRDGHVAHLTFQVNNARGQAS